jgi:hypothetical protein
MGLRRRRRRRCQLLRRQSRRQKKETSSLIQSRIGAARTSRSRSHSSGGVKAPALEVGHERGGLEDAARQVRQHMLDERGLGAGEHVVEALDDERRLRGDGALELGAEPAVALGGEPRPQGVALGGAKRSQRLTCLARWHWLPHPIPAVLSSQNGFSSSI